MGKTINILVVDGEQQGEVGRCSAYKDGLCNHDNKSCNMCSDFIMSPNELGDMEENLIYYRISLDLKP